MHSFAVDFKRRFSYLNVLINNAGEFIPEDKLSEDGIQVSSAVTCRYTSDGQRGFLQTSHVTTNLSDGVLQSICLHKSCDTKREQWAC